MVREIRPAAISNARGRGREDRDRGIGGVGGYIRVGGREETQKMDEGVVVIACDLIELIDNTVCTRLLCQVQHGCGKRDVVGNDIISLIILYIKE